MKDSTTSTAQMHHIVLSLTGVMSVFAITVPIAIARVSSTEKFAGQALNSQTCETYNPPKRQVVSWLETCRHMSVAPLVKNKSIVPATQLSGGINLAPRPN